jgi:uncharacterized protein
LQSTSDGDTALHIAAKRGHTAVCKRLLEAGGPRLLHKINCYKQTAMSPAVSGGSVEVVTLLHQQGALLNPPDNKLFTSLHTAALKNRLPVLRYLLEHGAAADVKAQNYCGVTSINLASFNNSVPMVELLLQHGADPSTASHEEDCALCTAVRGGYTDVVRVLLSSGMNAIAVLPCGVTPLLLACIHERTELIRMLVAERGVDVMQT